jgi:hypothetical protein
MSPLGFLEDKNYLDGPGLISRFWTTNLPRSLREHMSEGLGLTSYKLESKYRPLVSTKATTGSANILLGP